jgi:hypothetical protein
MHVHLPIASRLLAGAITLFGLVADPSAEAAESAPASIAPVVAYRTIMPDSGPASFAVGLPGGLGFCYDPGRGGINYAWQGDFADLSPTWAGKINQPAEIRGRIFYRETIAQPLRPGSADRVPKYSFKGYRFTDHSIEFHYTLDGTLVREEIAPLPDGSGLERRFRIDNPAGAVWFLAEGQDAAVVSTTTGRWLEGQLRFVGGSAADFTLTIRRKPEP